MTTAPPSDVAADITHRRILSIALPMTLAYASTPLLGIVDTTIIGRLGRADLLGGLAIGAILFDIVFSTFNFLRAGTTGLAAQAKGAGNKEEIGTIFFRALSLGVLCGIVVVAFSPLILRAGLWLMGPRAEVADAVTRYFEIRVLSAPFALANYAILGWYLGLARSGVALTLQILLNATNIALNIALVVGLGLSIEGVAWGTVIAEAMTAIVGVILVLRHLGPDRWHYLRAVFEASRLAPFFALNRDIMIRSLCLVFAFAWFTRMGTGLGETMLAANAILMNFFLLASFILDGFAAAAEQLSGEMLGARRKQAFMRATKIVLFWGLGFATVLTILFLAFGDAAIGLMTTNDDVRRAASSFIFWAAITPILCVAAFHFDGVFIGATWSDDMRNMMLVSTVSFVALSLALVPTFGNLGLWIAMSAFFALRGLTLAIRFPVRAARSFT